MGWPTERLRPRGRFGAIYQAHMKRCDITPSGLSHRLDLAGHRLHVTAIAHYMSEDRVPSPDRINWFAQALDLDETQTTELHRAAALDYGFEIGDE